MKGIVSRILAVFFSLALVLPGCGGDDGTGPGDGNGGGEKTILSAATSDGWTCHFYITEVSGPSCEYYRQYESERIEDFWIPGGFRVATRSARATDCCNSQGKRGTITSGKIDLSGYETVRLKTHLTFYEDHWVSGTYGEIRVTLYSNVPNTPDLLRVIDEHFVAVSGLPTLIEKDIDVSLENAIGYKEATIEIRINVNGGCGGYWLNDLSVEVGNFRIVGTK